MKDKADLAGKIVDKARGSVSNDETLSKLFYSLIEKNVHYISGLLKIINGRGDKHGDPNGV